MPEWKQFANLPLEQVTSLNQWDWLEGQWRLGLLAQNEPGGGQGSTSPLPILRNMALTVENHLALELGIGPSAPTSALKSSRSHTKSGPLLLAGAVSWTSEQILPVAFGLDLEWGHRRPISFDKEGGQSELANKFLNPNDHPKLWSWATMAEHFLRPWCLKEASFKAASNLIQQANWSHEEEVKVTLLKEIVLNKIEQRHGICFTQGYFSTPNKKQLCLLEGIFFTTTLDFTLQGNKKAEAAIALARATLSS